MTIENERVVQNRVIASNVNTPTSKETSKREEFSLR